MSTGRVERKRRVCFALLILISVLVLPCNAGQSGEQDTGSGFSNLEARPWEEADQLFRSDLRWRGGDVAYSIDLGHERVLWLFGDSFIADKPGGVRSASHMVHNGIAIETGYDPSKASLKFYWR